MAHTGRKPRVAIPAAKMTACSSAMPTSKYRLGMMRPEEIESGAVGHGSGDGHNAGILIGQIGQGFGEDFRPGRWPAGKVLPVSGSYGPSP